MLHASFSEYAVCFDLRIFHDCYFPLNQMIPIFHICHLVNNTSLFCYKQALKMHTLKKGKKPKKSANIIINIIIESFPGD